MSTSTPTTTETNHSTNGIEEPNTIHDWVKCKKTLSNERLFPLPSSGGTNSQNFLSVQVPSCQNFALGDSQKNYDCKMGFLPEIGPLFCRTTDEIEVENALTPPVEELNFSLNKKDCPENIPIFSEFIEELLFESSPIFDDDEILIGAELTDEGKWSSKTPIDERDISETLELLIGNLEGLESLDLTSTLANRLHQSSEVTTKLHSNCTDPLLERQVSSSHLQLEQSSLHPICSSIFPNSKDVESEYSEGSTASSLVLESTLKSGEPLRMQLSTIQSDCSTLPDLPMEPMVNGLNEDYAEISSERLSEESHNELELDEEFTNLEKPDAEPSVVHASSDLPSIQIAESSPVHQSVDIQPSPESSNGLALINFGASCDQTVQSIGSQFGLKQSSENWDLLWLQQDPCFSKQAVTHSIEMYKNLKSYQRVNHFPGSWGLGLKDLLAKNLNYMRKYFPNEYDFFPETWILPTNVVDLEKHVSHNPERQPYFIIKPADHGDVEITREIRKVSESNESVCQVYLNPFLINGYKFDFRVYVLVTSCEPLRVFVYREGLARFATEKYEQPEDLNSTNMFMHLTNTRINIRSPKYARDELCGSLRKMSTVFQWLDLNNFDVRKIQASMDDAICKTIIANLATLRDYYQICFPRHSFPSACFEIMGFDVMLDDRLKLYLLDVDCSPSFDCDGGDPFETEIKTAMLGDVFTILNLSETRKNQRTEGEVNSVRETLLERLMRRKREISAAQIQSDWENAHLGGFRKIYPPESCCKARYFTNFIDTALRNPHLL